MRNPFKRQEPQVTHTIDYMVKIKHFDYTHFKAVTIGDRKFVYCPVGNICSWHPGDYDNAWCPWCKKYFSEIEKGKK